MYCYTLSIIYLTYVYVQHISVFAGLPQLHNLDDRSWEIELNSSQNTIANMNTLVENNRMLTNQVKDMSEEIKELKAMLKEKDKIITEKTNEIDKLKRSTAVISKVRVEKVDPTLSRLMREIYPKLTEEEKFRTYEQFDSDHNKAATNRLSNLLREESNADILAIKFAIKSRFQTEKKSAVETPTASKLRRRVSRRHGKFNARKKCAVQYQIHAEIFSNLTADDMSDEESIDGEQLKVKKPTWRTAELEVKLKDIDAKLNCGQRKLRKRKILGSPSARCAKL